MSTDPNTETVHGVAFFEAVKAHVTKTADDLRSDDAVVSGEDFEETIDGVTTRIAFEGEDPSWPTWVTIEAADVNVPLPIAWVTNS